MIPFNKTTPHTWVALPGLLRWLACLALVIAQASISNNQSAAYCCDIEVRTSDEEDNDDVDNEGRRSRRRRKEEREAMNNPWRIDTRKFIAAKKFQMKQTFLTDVEIIDRICELKPKQKLKLSIAAKGATEKQLRAWVKKTDRASSAKWA